MNINEQTIKLQSNKQLVYKPIYSLSPVELEIFKTYIKTNLTNDFIWPSKSPAGIFIFFVQKLNSGFWLYIDY